MRKVQLWGYQLLRKINESQHFFFVIFFVFLANNCGQRNFALKIHDILDKLFDCKKYFIFSTLPGAWHFFLRKSPHALRKNIISGKPFAHHMLVLRYTHFYYKTLTFPLWRFLPPFSPGHLVCKKNAGANCVKIYTNALDDSGDLGVKSPIGRISTLVS